MRSGLYEVSSVLLFVHALRIVRESLSDKVECIVITDTSLPTWWGIDCEGVSPWVQGNWLTGETDLIQRKHQCVCFISVVVLQMKFSSNVGSWCFVEAHSEVGQQCANTTHAPRVLSLVRNVVLCGAVLHYVDGTHCLPRRYYGIAVRQPWPPTRRFSDDRSHPRRWRPRLCTGHHASLLHQAKGGTHFTFLNVN